MYSAPRSSAALGPGRQPSIAQVSRASSAGRSPLTVSRSWSVGFGGRDHVEPNTDDSVGGRVLPAVPLAVDLADDPVLVGAAAVERLPLELIGAETRRLVDL